MDRYFYGWYIYKQIVEVKIVRHSRVSKLYWTFIGYAWNDVEMIFIRFV